MSDPLATGFMEEQETFQKILSFEHATLGKGLRETYFSMEGFSEAWQILAPERLMVSADAEPHHSWQKVQVRYRRELHRLV